MQSKTRIFDQPQPLVERMIMNVEKVIVGKRETIEKAFVAMLSGGHLLLEDVPGVGKTMLVRALARTIGCEFKRIQCTPDLLPSDVTGVSVFNVKTNDFEFRPGPLMTPSYWRTNQPYLTEDAICFLRGDGREAGYY